MTRHKLALPDTNTILRYLLSDHAEQYAVARDFFEAVREGKRQALLLDGVLVECVYVLTKFYKVPRVEAAGELRALLLYKGVLNSDRQELLDALKRYAETKLDIVDCLLLARSIGKDAEVFSLDAHLRVRQD